MNYSENNIKTININDKLTFNQLKKNMKVKDIFGNIGTIKSIDDIHNILITFPKGGYGYFCLDENCSDGVKYFQQK